MSVTKPGVRLTGNDALEQSISLYFRTVKSSICLHPEQGFGIFNYVDRNIGAVLNLIREVRTGLALWDNRYIVIKAIPVFSVGKLQMKVSWLPADQSTNIIQSQIYNIE